MPRSNRDIPQPVLHEEASKPLRCNLSSGSPSDSSSSTQPTSSASTVTSGSSKQVEIDEFPTKPVTKYVDVLARQIVESSLVRKAVKDSSYFNRARLAPSGDFHFVSPFLFKACCVCDPHIPGQPIRLESKSFTPPTRSLVVGTCCFLNLPFNKADGCGLTVNPGRDGRSCLLLECVVPMTELSTGRIPSLLVAHIDVTNIVRSIAAREILASHAQVPRLYEAKDAGGIQRNQRILDKMILDLLQPSKSRNESTLSVHQNAPFLFQTDYDPVISENDWDWLLSQATYKESLNSASMRASKYKNLAPVSESKLRGLVQTIDYIKSLHHDIFILSPIGPRPVSQNSPRAPKCSKSSNAPIEPNKDKQYHVTHVSPSLLPPSAGKTSSNKPIHLPTPLINTPIELLQRLGQEFSSALPVSANGVRWGVEGRIGRLYCVPVERGGLFDDTGNRTSQKGLGAGIHCWVCFFIDHEAEDFWR